jgi:hypothetical protein
MRRRRRLIGELYANGVEVVGHRRKDRSASCLVMRLGPETHGRTGRSWAQPRALRRPSQFLRVDGEIAERAEPTPNLG